MQLSKNDAARSLSAYHFDKQDNIVGVMTKLRSVQFDPLSPIGCNHDLVFQARIKNYLIDDWKIATYSNRQIYDGWDKQASLVTADGWPLRRIFHQWHKRWWERIFEGHPEAVQAILAELKENGPMLPRQFKFQLRRDDWTGSWHGASVTKQTLRALWHSGQIMTANRQGSNHIYDLTERVVASEYINQPLLSEEEAIRGILLDRHQTMGIVRPNAQAEVWSIWSPAAVRNQILKELVNEGMLTEVDIEGTKVHAHPDFLKHLETKVNPKVTFIAPLDPFIWDRKMIAHIFGFDYIWEVYTHVSKRKWGYYFLPFLFGDKLVGRIEFYARNGILEVRQLHWEPGFSRSVKFRNAFTKSMNALMTYSASTTLSMESHLKVLENKWIISSAKDSLDTVFN